MTARLVVAIPGTVACAMVWAIVPGLLAFAGFVPALAHASEGAPVSTVPYVTQADDTLYTIAARYLHDARDWTVLSQLNGMCCAAPSAGWR